MHFGCPTVQYLCSFLKCVLQFMKNTGRNCLIYHRMETDGELRPASSLPSGLFITVLAPSTESTYGSRNLLRVALSTSTTKATLAIVDAAYKFIWCNTGAAGSASDHAGVLNGSRLRTSLEEERIAFPDPEPLPGDDRDMPYFLVGDDAFVLRKWMMKPY